MELDPRGAFVHNFWAYSPVFLRFVVRRKLSFFGNTIRDGGGCELVKSEWEEDPRHHILATSQNGIHGSMEEIPQDSSDHNRLVRDDERAADHHS